MTTEKLPGAITATHLVDEAGGEVGLTYAGQLTDPDTGEVSMGAWLAWSQTNDILGRVRTDSTTFASQIAAAAGIEADAESAVEDPLDFDHRYTYDKGGNLTKVEDLTGLPVGGSEVSPYTVREYTFTTNGARKTAKETIRADGTTTGAATTGVNQSLTYDTADRLTGGYVYDLLGRQTTVPAAHAPNTAGGDITLAYFDSDLPAKVTQGGTATSFTLDVAQRRLVQSSVTAAKTTTTTRHYTDGSDNPSWIETARPDGTSETLRYTSSISGDLGASIATDGGTSLMLSNIHGDTATTIPIPSGTPATAAATTIAGWSSYTEYGTPIDPAQTAVVGTSAGYGWLGAKERSTAAGTVGLTLMGVRIYNRVTGAFTSTDNIVGANNTAYNYPTNPVGLYDLDGEKPRNKRRSNHRADRHWKKSDPVQRVRWGNKRGSAGGPSAGKKFSRKQLRKLKRSAGRCAYCQKHLKAGEGHGDHIVPRVNGGNSTPRNLQRTCSPCNLSKGARSGPGGGGGRGGFAAAGGFGGGKPYLKSFR
ncbi:hypothetical protein C1N80_09830 [Brachybacterium sp. SGAir0954]|uniref:HNH endonuclease n=1 Tax=Brachybacterium sp. SGAir0954 TaxID=2571029 RepID=UPI0010CD53BE|nr:HNH endonuclease signature motif containing protein [Brachybacterium sp. SGAir0954]QCR53843.1 hypothetical protein C1N80_09830 [Brachybacterium sp. SGAir0954]